MDILVDPEDEHLLKKYNWRANADGYACVNRSGNVIFLHSLIMGFLGVDHINRNPLDNRRSNLRPATDQQNTQNRRKWHKQGNSIYRSKYKGVYTKITRKGVIYYCSHIRENGALKYLGSFDTPEEAALVWDENARRLHGNFARLNFPMEGEESAL